MELLLPLIFGAFAGGLIVWAWWSVNPEVQIQKRKLESFRQQINKEKQELSNSEARLDQVSEGLVEAERRRISDELHDDLLQRLAGIRLYLLHISAIHSLPAEATQQLNQLAKDLNESMNTMRTLILDLALPDVKDKPLTRLIKELCLKVARTALLKVDFIPVMDEWQREMSEEVKRDLLRIVQESIHNAMKYSNGWHIVVTLQWHHSYVSITIADDGEGMKQSKGDSYGMDNLRKRADRIKAKLSFAANEPRGTIVKVELDYSLLGQ